MYYIQYVHKQYACVCFMYVTRVIFVFRSDQGSDLLPIHCTNKGMRQKNKLHTWNKIACRVGSLLVVIIIIIINNNSNNNNNTGSFKTELQIAITENLGVIIDTELKFHQHVPSLVNKAHQLLGIVKRTFTVLI